MISAAAAVLGMFFVQRLGTHSHCWRKMEQFSGRRRRREKVSIQTTEEEEGKNTVPLLSSIHENGGDDDSENTLSITGGIVVVGSVARPGSIFYGRKHSAAFSERARGTLRTANELKQ